MWLYKEMTSNQPARNKRSVLRRIPCRPKPCPGLLSYPGRFHRRQTSCATAHTEGVKSLSHTKESSLLLYKPRWMPVWQSNLVYIAAPWQ